MFWTITKYRVEENTVDKREKKRRGEYEANGRGTEKVEVVRSCVIKGGSRPKEIRIYEE